MHADVADARSARLRPHIVRGDAGSSPGTVDGRRRDPGQQWREPHHADHPRFSGNPALVGDDTGREVTSITINGTAIPYGSSTYTTDFPNGLFGRTVSDTGELYPSNSGGPTVAASFQAIDDAGNPVHAAGRRDPA